MRKRQRQICLPSGFLYLFFLKSKDTQKRNESNHKDLYTHHFFFFNLFEIFFLRKYQNRKELKRKEREKGKCGLITWSSTVENSTEKRRMNERRRLLCLILIFIFLKSLFSVKNEWKRRLLSLLLFFIFIKSLFFSVENEWKRSLSFPSPAPFLYFLDHMQL